MNLTVLIVQLIAGAVGGNAAGGLAKDASLGPVLNTILGANRQRARRTDPELGVGNGTCCGWARRGTIVSAFATGGVSGGLTALVLGFIKSKKLGVTADGQFGAGTEKALRDYQQKSGLAVDGLAGPATLAQMKLFKEITAATVTSSQVPASAVADAAKGAVADAGAGLRSIWDTLKSIVSK